ncbi:MAG: EAL domain-containing protein [Rhodocyclaceae bacterium]|jgi:EAL domain-containing protein (putative c-di-GMP-specific phosphodiesterase class I)/DNA-binding NarL/FixJ family response regulator|nr:EAL domain-containing protein [Rhodocyclaceae bacterium]
MKINELHLLIVEDDDFQRQLVAGMLRSLGVAALSESANGRQALGIIRSAGSRPVDVALCDLKMPEMDGMEFLRHLGQENHKVAIVITSAVDSKLLSSVGRMARMYGIKLLGLIEKPVVLDRLKEILAKHGNTENKWQRPAEAKHFTLDEIRQGIRANQFEPFFQPKVSFKTGRLEGAEALARWIHPEMGVIGPDAFIPLLEQSGEISDLTFLMLEKGLAACRSFHDKGHLISISINLSLVSLDDSILADMITQVVRQAGVDPQYIVLEITESVAMTDVPHALENLARLCMNGFSLSIDDYGTGYSSLQQLTRVAYSELKIDQSFVRGFTENNVLRIVVESSIEMAHRLQVKSIAEGVESQQDWNTLKIMGCDVAQGYFVGKPMDIGAFQDFMKKHANKAVAVSLPVALEQSEINVLVVEDDDFTRKIILSVLRTLGFAKVTDAANVEFSLKLLESNAFDLIITDVEMPGVNGLKFIQMIRAGRTFAKRETRIIVLTAFSQTEILSAALALDINGFLVKPITPALVEEKISKAISERLHLHPALAYEAVRTDFRSLRGAGDIRSANDYRGASIPLPVHKETGRNESREGTDISLQRLRPGMILTENINLTDGTLLLSSGHVLTELSINRLYDIRSLLKKTRIAVQAMPETLK